MNLIVSNDITELKQQMSLKIQHRQITPNTSVLSFKPKSFRISPYQRHIVYSYTNKSVMANICRIFRLGHDTQYTSWYF